MSAMIRLFALLALLVPGVALAPSVASAQPIPGAGCPKNASPCTVTATGGTTAKTEAIFHGTMSQQNTYDAFGDSITAGYAASTPALNFVSLVGAATGTTPTNHGLSGTQAADNANIIYPFSVSSSASQLLTFMVGTNDAFIYGTSANKQASFALMHAADVAFLAIPSANKYLGQSGSITYGGTWVNSANYGGAISKQSTTNGSTATFTVYGSVAYIAYSIQTGNGGTFSISVDGGPTTSHNATGVGNASITTNLGQTYGSALLRLSGLSVASHTIVLTVTSVTNAANVVTLDWVAGAAGSNFYTGPTVVVGGVPRQNVVGSDASIAPYNVIAKANVAMLAGDGLNVTFADTTSHINPATDLIADNVHPNDTGEGHLRDAFMAAINGASSAATKSAASPGGINSGNVTSYTGPLLQSANQGPIAQDYWVTVLNNSDAGGNTSTTTLNLSAQDSSGGTPTQVRIRSGLIANTPGGATSIFDISTSVAGTLGRRISVDEAGNIGLSATLLYPTDFLAGLQYDGSGFITLSPNTATLPTITTGVQQGEINADNYGGGGNDAGALILSAGGRSTLSAKMSLTLKGFGSTDSTQAVFKYGNTAVSKIDSSGFTPTIGMNPAGGFALSPRTIGTCEGAANVAYTSQTPVATEFYVAEVRVPANVTVTGVAIYNSATISGNVKVGLANSSGANVAASASTAMAGTSAYQLVPFTGTYAAVGPATYYVEVFYDNATARPNTFTAGACGVAKATGQVFATGFTTISAPTTFTTALGPVATLY